MWSPCRWLTITVSTAFVSIPCWRSAVRLVAPQSSSTEGGEAGSGAKAMQVWNRPPEPNASPLPTTVTRISRSSCPASIPSYQALGRRTSAKGRPLICGPC